MNRYVRNTKKKRANRLDSYQSIFNKPKRLVSRTKWTTVSSTTTWMHHRVPTTCSDIFRPFRRIYYQTFIATCPPATWNPAPCFAACPPTVHVSSAATVTNSSNSEVNPAVFPHSSTAQTWGTSSYHGACSSGACRSFTWLLLFLSMCRYQVRIITLRTLVPAT